MEGNILLFELNGFKNNCRACAENLVPENMVNLFDSDSDKSILAEIYTQCTLLKVSVTDGLPTYLCNGCHQRLIEFNSFRLSCISSDQFFRNKMIIKDEKYEFANIINTTVHPDSPVELEYKDENTLKTNTIRKRTDVKRKARRKSNSASRPDNIVFKEEPADITLTDWNSTEINNYFSDENVNENSDDTILNGQLDEKPSGKNTLHYKCDICNKKCVKKICLEAHMRTHQGLKPYECLRCGRGFVKRSHFNEHLSFHNNVDNKVRYTCTFHECGRSYPRKQSLASHIRNFHRKNDHNVSERNHTCEMCGKSFKRKDYLRSHMYTHTGMPLQCEICPKKCASKYQLAMHMNRHNGIKNHVCSICGLRKTTGHELRTHMKFHSGEKKFACTFCPKRFATLSNMNLHERVVHRGIRSFQCQYCDRSFGKAETLKHHTMTHTGEKPHACDICGKRFIQSIALQTHMKTHKKDSTIP